MANQVIGLLVGYIGNALFDSTIIGPPLVLYGFVKFCTLKNNNKISNYYTQEKNPYFDSYQSCTCGTYTRKIGHFRCCTCNR
jgi:hypothetical protein